MNANDKWLKLTHETSKNLAKKQRTGQAYINALYSVDSVLYNKISGTIYDCFYDDNLVQSFLTMLASQWSEEKGE